MKKTRFLIADDHAIVRNGIRRVLASKPGYTIVAEANDGEEAVQFARQHKPDIIIEGVIYEQPISYFDFNIALCCNSHDGLQFQ